MRVPSGGPATKEREALLSYYRKRLAEFERIPAHRREAECANEGEATCRAMIAELERRRSWVLRVLVWGECHHSRS